MPHRCTVPTLVAILGALALPALAAGEPAASPVVFHDPAGDGGGSPDITRVAIGNTATVLTVAVRLAARPSGPNEHDTVTLFLDTDGSGATGDPGAHGADFRLHVEGAGPAQRARWTATGWDDDPHGSVTAAWTAPDLVFTAGLAALGGPSGELRFSLLAVWNGINPEPNTDRAPDGAGESYAYTLGAGDPPSPPPSAAPPNTRIVGGPHGTTSSRVATFRFRSTKPGSTFRCKLDGRPWHRCSSPRTWRGLAPGRHVFRVAARDAGGRLDPTPAVRAWRIRR